MNTFPREFALLEFVFLLADATVKAAFLLTLAAAVALLSRRASASFRHLVWALALGCVLVLPLLSRSLPHWHLAVRTPVAHQRQAALPPPPTPPSPSASGGAIVSDKAAPEGTPSAPVAAASQATNPPALTPPQIPPAPAQTSDRISWMDWVALGWAAGALLALARIGRGATCLRVISRFSTRAPEAQIAHAKAAMRVLRVSRPITLLTASAAARVSVPITWGALRPVIVFPAEAAAWPVDKLRAALLHELAHVRRGDWLLQTLAHLACAFHWFNPLVWLAARRMRAESEAACDDLVLAAGIPAPDYARHLLDVALGARNGRQALAGAVAMAQTARIEGRLRAVLSASSSRGAVRGRVAAWALIAALLLALPLAALRLTAQAQPVPEADHLQLGGDFTLRYAVTVTDLETPQARLHEYQQLRRDYDELLKKDPYRQPVPADYYAPFSYFQERQPSVRHLILTVSARNGVLLWRSQEGGHAFALAYNGRNGTQLFSDGHDGRIENGFKFGEMTDCPLPAVGLPYAPLFNNATIASTDGANQTWEGQCLVLNGEGAQNAMVYAPGTIRVVKDGGTWKVLFADSLEQRLDFLEHQRFHRLWLASRFRLTKYDISALPPQGQMTTMQQAEDWMRARRTPNSVC